MYNTSRLINRSIPRLSAISSTLRPFHATAANMVKKGDSIPSVPLVENAPSNKVDLAKELTGKGVIIGVPAAFSPGCTASHIPGYINHEKLKDAGKVFVISVNDAFVMAAWGKVLDPSGKSNIRFLGDPSAEFTKSLDLTFDSIPVFGNNRSKRYALIVDGGKVQESYVEPDNTGITISAADKVLG